MAGTQGSAAGGGPLPRVAGKSRPAGGQPGPGVRADAPRTGGTGREPKPAVSAAGLGWHHHPHVSPAWPQPEACGTPANGGSTMSAADKVNNTAETAKGKVNAGAGTATGNESLQAEGHADQAKADLKQAGEKIKDLSSRTS